ncbi:MAG: Hsp20/alpha crystallin family protein [Acidobacteriota bacterium]|jgi:HSP20 family protein|nr:MAG: heat-shock protein Hsp20 [Acidobacteriota bacterium]
MALVRWDPFRELEDMYSRLARMMGSATRGLDDAELFTDWSPALDVEETDEEYIVKTDLPEVKKDEVKVSVENGVLCIEGERKKEKEEKTRKMHRVERSYGRFVRRVAVPTDADATKVSAEFKDGVLSVHLPKSESVKPRAVEVKVK